ncbi:hypothetical protein OY671_011467, partial [Metschnikowia pulcherrima]
TFFRASNPQFYTVLSMSDVSNIVSQTESAESSRGCAWFAASDAPHRRVSVGPKAMPAVGPGRIIQINRIGASPHDAPSTATVPPSAQPGPVVLGRPLGAGGAKHI